MEINGKIIDERFLTIVRLVGVTEDTDLSLYDQITPEGTPLNEFGEPLIVYQGIFGGYHEALTGKRIPMYRTALQPNTGDMEVGDIPRKPYRGVPIKEQEITEEFLRQYIESHEDIDEFEERLNDFIKMSKENRKAIRKNGKGM